MWLNLHRRKLVYARRVAAAWLLIAAVFVGPLGNGAAMACGSLCPCDDAHPSTAGSDDHRGCTQDDASASSQQKQGPVDDDYLEDCPDDCPDCSCCSGSLVALVPLNGFNLLLPPFSLTLLPAPETPALGACFDVYRPPRSRF